MIEFLKSIRKAIAAGLVAGGTTFQGGATLQVSIAAGIIAAGVVWAVPNTEAP